MNKIYNVLLVAISISPILSHAQLQVKGLVQDDKGSSVPFASVLLLSSSDSTLIQGQVSNTDGLFAIDVKETGSYFISVSAVGYQSVSTPIISLNRNNSPFDAGKIVTAEKVEELNEVVVKAERPMFEQKIDRTVINVQSNIARAGGSALDVLQRSPGVTVDRMNKTMALSGKQGVRVMINGKISRIPMEAVVQMLDGMNAENIDRIELITTPPSKYEAEGDAGMINIVMKQTVDQGTNGNLSLFTGYGRRGKFGGTLNLNNRTKNFNIYGDLSSRNDYSRQFFNTRWSTPVEGISRETTSNNERNAFTGANSGTVGFDWNIGKKTALGGSFNFFDRTWDMDALANITMTENQALTSTVLMTTTEENDWLQLLGDINLHHQFNDRFSMAIDLDRINYDSENPTDYYQDYYDSQGLPTTDGQLRSTKDTGIKIWTTALDLTGKLNDRIVVEAGAKGSFTKLSNDIVVDRMVNGSWDIDEKFTSYADMEENIAAGYVSTTIKASDKIDIQAGIRYEHTITDIDTSGTNVIARNYGTWFPSVFLNNRINDNNSWVVSYSRRVARPSFFQLAPFVIFNDPNNFYSGNVSLLPSFTDAFKLEYRHKSMLVSLQYSHDKNSITLFQPEINDDNQQVSTAQNLDYRDNFSIVLSFPIQVTEWWEMQFNCVGSRYYLKASYLDEPISISITNFSFNGSQKFKLSKTITAEFSGYYQSRQLFGVAEFSPLGSLDFGIEKRFKNSNLRLSYSDIFETNKWTFYANIPSENLDTSAYLDFETTVVNITYTLNFGNNMLKAKRSAKSGSKEEQERLSQ